MQPNYCKSPDTYAYGRCAHKHTHTQTNTQTNMDMQIVKSKNINWQTIYSVCVYLSDYIYIYVSVISLTQLDVTSGKETTH